jgi:preprotein translocase subunit SecD
VWCTRAATVLLVTSALAAIAGGSGCKKQPALRLTYEVDVRSPDRREGADADTDVASAHDKAIDLGQILDTSRKVVAHRVGALGSVATQGQSLTIDLPPLEAEELRALKQVIARRGRLSFQVVDDAASVALFGAMRDHPDDEGITLYTEATPDGLDAGGARRSSRSPYARITCRPPRHSNEPPEACLRRFRMWIASLHPPDARVVSVQAITESVSGTDPLRLQAVGWRTLVLNERAELTQDDITDASIGRNSSEAGNGYYLLLTLSPSGAARFKALTGANVNRRLSIVIDDVVNSAPVIREEIGGGKATITMGAFDPEQQLSDAKQLRLVLLSGALPAPLRLVNEESLRGR